MQDIHPLVRPLQGLIGKWLGSNGDCIYPTIKSIKYNEELTIEHPAVNQPMLHLNFKSWVVNENGDKKFLHFESGFLKVKPNSTPLELTYTSSHNNGLTIVEEGTLEENSKITLESKNVARISSSKPPHVVKTRRELILADDLLTSRMFMSTTTTPELTEHLNIAYKRLKEF